MGEPLPRRLRWRPGVHVVRRDGDHLQVGVDMPRRVILPDRPGVRALLAELPATADESHASAALRSLRAAGLVLEGGEPGSDSPGDPAARRAAEAQFGEDAARRLAARADARIGLRAPPGPRATARRLLRGAGLGLAGPDDLPTAWLVVTAAEPLRSEIDPLVREGAPHLLAVCGAAARVGPFVVTGQTACLRCVDAHLAEPDPRRPLVVEQVARATADADDVPVDPTLEVLALAHAVRDLARYAEGDRPATWSATVDIDHAAPAGRQVWERHPHCGCAWDVVW
ncbi:MAG TPA: hypothetical protein VFO49_19115 [Nocardioides sp.]|nr:hypothetical protein [Nocardioides sp.]